MNRELFEALCDGDLRRAGELLSGGADINEPDEEGETILLRVIFHGCDAVQRHAVVRFMLDHGADPRLLNDAGAGPLLSALIVEDIETLRLLLDNGADPNREHELGESLYNYAEFNYRDETYHSHLPESPTEADKASENSWLEFLDRLAVKYDKPRPDYLMLLRERGALTNEEQKRHKTGE